MFKCTFENCEQMFASEPARRGHLGTHKSRKRAGGQNKRFVQKKYCANPTRKRLQLKQPMLYTCRLPGSRRRLPIIQNFLPADAGGYDGDSTIYSRPEQSTEELEQYLQNLREWVAASSSKYNKELLKWLSKLPFKTPNKQIDNRFLPFIADIRDEHGVNENITNTFVTVSTFCQVILKILASPETFKSCRKNQI